MTSKLQITPSEKINDWAEIVRELRRQGKDIYLVGDTETTGGVSGNSPSVYENVDKEFKGQIHRILELGFILCTKNINGEFERIKDKDGSDIFFHEYINPFAEDNERLEEIKSIKDIPRGAEMVHGINKRFLFGKLPLSLGNGKELTMKGSAPCFQDVIVDFMKLTTCQESLSGNLYAVFHNTAFDIIFMDSEFSYSYDDSGNRISRFQDFFIPYDTVQYFKENIDIEELKELKERSGVTKGKYSLDTLTNILTELGYMGNNFDRDLHGAYKDSLILIEIYNGVVKYKQELQENNLELDNKPVDFSQFNFNLSSFNLGESEGQKRQQGIKI